MQLLQSSMGSFHTLEEKFKCINNLKYFFLVNNNTICENKTQLLQCPTGTFININKVIIGKAELCNYTMQNQLNCTVSEEDQEYNNIRAYEQCQNRVNCTFNATFDVFRDPCPGFGKYVQINFTCTPGK